MKYFILFLFLLFVQQSWSQSYKFGLQSGIGSYGMSDLKTLNEQVFPGIPFNTKLVSNFPSYIYYRPSVLMYHDGYALGLVNTFQSTGSRISGKDYSGEYRFDMTISSNCPGIYFERPITSAHNLQFTYYIILGCSFTKLKINEYYKVLDEQLNNEDIKFKSLNFYVEPGFNLQYPVKTFSVGINGGYYVPFGNEALYTDNNKKHSLYNSKTNQPITPGWNGFRMGISL